MRARPRRLPRGSRRGFLRDGTFSRLCLLWEAVHPICRHCTPSDRVHCDVTGVARRNGCSASRSEPGEHVEAVSQRLRWAVGVCGGELPAVVLVVGGGAPDL